MYYDMNHVESVQNFRRRCERVAAMLMSVRYLRMTQNDPYYPSYVYQTCIRLETEAWETLKKYSAFIWC